MKRKITLLFLAASTALTVNSQVMIQEDFTSPFNPATNGWSYQNLTGLPAGTPGQNWFQGNPAVFNSYNGAPADYLAANWASSTNTVSPETISNWLISPTVTIVNGAVLQFASRTNTNPASFPDRLEVYYSIGAGTNVGSTASSLGTFSTLIVTINSALSTTGYPGVWTIYTNPITGVPLPTVGRIGFRYSVTNGGPATSAINSDFIGLDAVKYSIPCGVTLNSYTVCAGSSATIMANGGSATNTYTWAPGGSNSSSIVVTPGSTTTYSLTYNEGSGNCPVQTSTVTIGAQLSINVAASSPTVCAGSSVTFTASSAAASYSWNTGATNPVITVTPNASTTYTVAGYNGIFPSITCYGFNTVNVTVIANPTISYVLTPTTICQGSTYTLNASGAANYIWFNSATTGFTNNPLSLTAGAAGPRQYTLAGFNSAGCGVGTLVSFTVNPNPTITVVTSKTLPCINTTVNLTASGANSYVWTGAGSSTSNPYTFPTGFVAANNQFTVTGTDLAGCTATVAFTQSVSVCGGISVNANNESVSIYPNPFTNELKINQFEGRVLVYSALGQVVIDVTLNANETINTSELSKGTYLVKAFNTNGEAVLSTKLLKN